MYVCTHMCVIYVHIHILLRWDSKGGEHHISAVEGLKGHYTVQMYDLD